MLKISKISDEQNIKILSKDGASNSATQAILAPEAKRKRSELLILSLKIIIIAILLIYLLLTVQGLRCCLGNESRQAGTALCMMRGLLAFIGSSCRGAQSLGLAFQ